MLSIASILITSLLSLVRAQTLSLRPQQPHHNALVEHKSPTHHPQPPTHYSRPQPLDSTGDVLDSLDLLDILLLASVDGKFHALNRTSGDILWSMASPNPNPHSNPHPTPSSAFAPLVRTDHIDYDPDLTDDSTPHEMYIIEPQSGDIYVLPNPSSPLQRFPFTMQELVDMSPFSFSSGDDDSDDYDGRVFVGKKETSLLVVELETGKIKATLNSECPWDQFEEFRKTGREDDEVDLDELEGSKPQKPPTTDVYIGRTDYHVSIITRPNPTSSSYRPSSPNLIQNLSFSTYGPNRQDNHLQSLYRRTKDNAYTQPLPSGDILSFRARSTVDSGIPSEGRWMNGHLLWMSQEFQSPMVAVFDVLRKTPTTTSSSAGPRPFVLLQPRPKIQDLIPNLPETVKVNPLAAYVGLVNGNARTSVSAGSGVGSGVEDKGGKGSLFAMSPQNYPLVAFGRGDYDIAGEEYRPLIDPSTSSSPIHADTKKEEGEGDELEEEGAKSVDELTRMRKMREASQPQSSHSSHWSLHSATQQHNFEQCADPKYQRQCLTGIRRLSSSPPSAQNTNKLLDPLPHPGLMMDYDDYYKRFFPSPSNGVDVDVGAGDVGAGVGMGGVGEGPLTIDPPPVPPRLPPGDARMKEASAHSGMVLGMRRWESVGMTLVLALVIGVVMTVWAKTRLGELWRKVVEGFWRAKEEMEMEKQVRQGEVKEEVVRTASGEGDDIVSPSLLSNTKATTEVDKADDNILSVASPTTSSSPASNTVADSSPPVVPPISTTTAMAPGEETDKEDQEGGSHSDAEDFVVINENSAGTSTPKPTKGAPTPASDTPDTPKKKTRRGRRPAKKPKNANKNVNGIPGGGGDGEESQVQAQTPAPAPSLLVVESAVKPVLTPSPSLVVSETVLGYGSHGTVVYRGSLQGRAVAVKRLLADFVTLASREVSILQESDDHPNVIRYYYQEAHAGFLYIALELCPASLADIVETPDRDQWRDIAVGFDPKKALRQVTNGLRHLHGLKLVHRDIKPQNILVTTVKGRSNSSGGSSNGSSGGGYRMLISDFGLCKKLEMDQTSFLPTAHGAMAAGTVGWRAPEILSGEVKLNELADDQGSQSSNTTVHGAASFGSTHSNSSSNNGTTGRTRLTKNVDIFALGCLYYYTLTGGGHPFGDRYEREVNIMKNAKNLEVLERFGEEGTEAMNLIEKMLDPLPSGRPDTTLCLLHPFFWDSSRRLNFLQDASDRFEIMCRDPKDPNLLTLETGAAAIVGNDWHARLDKIFIENLGKFRKYDGRSVQDLLRALRNKKHHYQDLPDNVKRHLGPMPEGFLAYFTRRFPNLFLHVHRVVKETRLANESMFRNYFELPDS